MYSLPKLPLEYGKEHEEKTESIPHYEINFSLNYSNEMLLTRALSSNLKSKLNLTSAVLPALTKSASIFLNISSASDVEKTESIPHYEINFSLNYSNEMLLTRELKKLGYEKFRMLS